VLESKIAMPPGIGKHHLRPSADTPGAMRENVIGIIAAGQQSGSK